MVEGTKEEGVFLLRWSFELTNDYPNGSQLSSSVSSPRRVRLCAPSSALLHLGKNRIYHHAVTDSSRCFYLECLFNLAALQQLIGGVTLLLELENMFVLLFSKQKLVSKYSSRTRARALMKTSAPMDSDVFFWPGSLAVTKDLCQSQRLRFVRPMAYFTVRIQ